MCHFTSMLEWIHHFTNKHVAWTCGFDWTCPWVASWTKYMLTSKFSDRCLTAAVDAAGSECGAMNQDRCSLLWPCAVQCNAVDVPRSPHNAQPCKPRLGWSGRCWPPTLVSVTDSAVVLHPATALGHQGPTQILGSSIFLANMCLIWLGDPFKICSHLLLANRSICHGDPTERACFRRHSFDLLWWSCRKFGVMVSQQMRLSFLVIPQKLWGHISSACWSQVNLGSCFTSGHAFDLQSSWLFWGKQLSHPISSAGDRVVASVHQILVLGHFGHKGRCIKFYWKSIL